jgi:hypothetical protein
VDQFLRRHAAGDWGDVSSADRRANEDALQTGARLLSAYRTHRGERLWVVTEATGDDGSRGSTCVLLPAEY